MKNETADNAYATDAMDYIWGILLISGGIAAIAGYFWIGCIYPIALYAIPMAIAVILGAFGFNPSGSTLGGEMSDGE